ncbi:uncharacterized protein LOC135837033 [Planococcus citri]|uniref:uncharacterized protein LOC135837033 n=1 Tax=Planococcus citri TaxID=170843 RepID=UPI0031FA15E3
MVLFSKLFFCASIPCYILGNPDVSLNPALDSLPAFNEKRELADVNESIEGDLLKYCSTEDKQKKYLKEKLIKAVMKNRRYQYEDSHKIKNLVKEKNEAQGMVCACLTRQALENVERFAFPPVLYNNDNLSRYAKWMLALHVYETPILDGIRELLRTAKLTYTAFASAADNVHSLISSDFAHPHLESYNLPQHQNEIQAFCSFLSKINPRKTLPADLLSDEPGEKVAVTLHKQAAELVCWAAFKYPTPITTPEFEYEICHASIDWFSATIIIRDVSEVDEPLIKKYLNTILDEDLFKGNVDNLKSERIPLQIWDKKDPSVAKKSGVFDLIFHLACKPFSELYLPAKSAKGDQKKLSTGDYYASEIRKRLSSGLGKTTLLLSSLTTYVRDVPEKYRPTTTTTTITQ